VGYFEVELDESAFASPWNAEITSFKYAAKDT
jgi:hypothetical protein